MRTAQSKLPSEAGPKLGSLRPAGGAPGGSSLPRLRERRASRPSSRTGAGRSKPCGALSSPPLHPGVCRQIRGARKKVTAKTGPFPRTPPCGRRTLRPHTPWGPERGARRSVRAPGVGVHVLSGATLPAAWKLEFSFKPALPLGHPPRPTGGDDVRSLVARRSPGCRCRSLTGAALRRQQPDLWRGCSRGDCCHPRTCQPGGGGFGGVKSKSPLGGLPPALRPSSDCSQARAPPRPPPQRKPPPRPCPLSLGVGLTGPQGGGEGAGKAGVETDAASLLPIHRFCGSLWASARLRRHSE